MNLVNSKTFFVLGVVIGLAVMATLNFTSLSVSENYVRQIGFPFTAYEWYFGGSVGQFSNFKVYDTINVGYFLWFGVFLDLVTALLFSTLCGALLRRIGHQMHSK